jgi:hypothetical protein
MPSQLPFLVIQAARKSKNSDPGRSTRKVLKSSWSPSHFLVSKIRVFEASSSKLAFLFGEGIYEKEKWIPPP